MIVSISIILSFMLVDLEMTMVDYSANKMMNKTADLLTSCATDFLLQNTVVLRNLKGNIFQYR